MIESPTKRNVRGIGVVDHPARALVATFCANIYLDVGFKGRIVRLDAFQKQQTITMLAVHGWQWLNEAAHWLPPSCDKRRNEQRGDAQKGPVIGDVEDSLTLWYGAAIDSNVYFRRLGVKRP